MFLLEGKARGKVWGVEQMGTVREMTEIATGNNSLLSLLHHRLLDRAKHEYFSLRLGGLVALLREELSRLMSLNLTFIFLSYYIAEKMGAVTVIQATEWCKKYLEKLSEI